MGYSNQLRINLPRHRKWNSIAETLEHDRNFFFFRFYTVNIEQRLFGMIPNSPCTNLYTVDAGCDLFRDDISGSHRSHSVRLTDEKCE